MFVITALSLVGLPMLNGFVGEFLILSGSMQSVIAHHIAWTVLATTGVILSASYMLWMIQRVFYGDLGIKSENVQRLGPRRPRASGDVAAGHPLPGHGSRFSHLAARHRHGRNPHRRHPDLLSTAADAPMQLCK